MRILASNPDTIGDLVLRQPLYRALADAGHELMLVVRPLLEPVVPMVAPGARVVVAAAPVYSGSIEPGDASLTPVVDAARTFDPDLLLIAPYQWTVLEERLSMALPRARCVALTGRLYRDPGTGASPPSIIKGNVPVAEDTPETHKNEKLASAVLARSVTLPDPRIEATPAQRRAAEAELSRLGLAPDGYWAACVGDTAHTAVRNWPADRWGALLAHWSRKHGRQFLFIGSGPEAATARRVRQAMNTPVGDAGKAAIDWFGSGEGAFDVLIGLIALSRGYVGRDTGPMHLAAAMSKPVLAVFGGGTWPRFLPAADRSVSITVGVPCAGCGWNCHLPEPYCIHEVPVSEAITAADALERDTVTTRTVRLLTPDATLLARIGREGAASSRERLTQLSVARKRAQEVEASMNDGGESVLAEAVFGVASAAEPKAWSPTVPGGAAERMHDELDQTRHQLAQARLRVAQLEAVAAEALQHRVKQAAEVAATRDYVVEIKSRIVALESKLEERTAELAAARERMRLEESASGQVERLKAELDKARAEVAVRVREAQAADQRIRGLAAQVDEAMTIGTAEHRKREAALLERLNDARTKLTAAEGKLADLRKQTARTQEEKAALARLTAQHERQLALLRARVRDLVASRWRKLGQRLHLAMELPWEHEFKPNGHAAPASRNS